MADGNGNGGAAQEATGAPSLNALGQYLKDLSFENPNAPRSLGPQEKSPNIGIQVNVNAKQLAPTDFEVSISLDAKAGEGVDLLFKLDLEYAGVFRLTNIPEEQMHPIIMIECPRLLFPFVRQIVADATRDGGFRRCSSTRSISSPSINKRPPRRKTPTPLRGTEREALKRRKAVTGQRRRQGLARAAPLVNIARRRGASPLGASGPRFSTST